MNPLLPLIAIIVLHQHLCSASQSLEYCVVPDAGTDCGGCPLNNTPCHTLQYYANNSYFTSNAIFYFLEGEHALDTRVEVRNVANLSLVGVGPQDSCKVQCVSTSQSAGFFVQNFVNFSVVNLSFYNCGRGALSTLYLTNGSGLNIDHVIVSNSPGYGLIISSLQNNASISNSVFTESKYSNVYITYYNCSGPSHFSINNCKFLNSYGANCDLDYGGLQLNIVCTNIHVTISNSLLNGNRQGNLGIGFGSVTGNFVQLSNTTISYGIYGEDTGAGMDIVIYASLPENDHLSCGDNSTRHHHYLMEISNVTIAKNMGMAFTIEDSISAGTDCNVQYILMKDSVITENQSRGYLIYLFNIYGQFKTIHITFINLSISATTALSPTLPLRSSMLFDMVLNVTFIDCTFENNQGTAIKAIASNLLFRGNHTFRNNSAENGAGIQLLGNSFMYLNNNTHIMFADNHASDMGGAIYVDATTITLDGGDICFYQITGISYVQNNFRVIIRIDFINNTADRAGSSLYMPRLYKCGDHNLIFEASFEDIFHIRNTKSDPSAVTSDPLRVCTCMPGNHMPNCSISTLSVSAYPGEDFTLHLALVGAMNGTVPGTIHAKLPHSSPQAHLGALQDSQMNIYAKCNDFTYTVFSTHKAVYFTLTPAGSPALVLTKIVNVDLGDCPIGFTLHQDTGACACDPVISRGDIHCFINNQSILRPANTWIGFHNSNNSNETGVVFSAHCPYGYCLARDVYLSSDDPDIQCVGNRTGVLCGQCVDGYSLTLGGQTCIKCSNLYLLLVFPLAAFGLVLVAVLFVLNLTVTDGTINGLIFYANVVSMSRSTQYSGTSSQLYTFIAWLNLDLGINTCFYDGMDAYAETWLQFTFPLYLWVIIIAIIVFFNKFPKLTSKGTQNAVKVLATLLLLSYTKLQRTLVTIFSFTTLRYPSGAVHYVWLYDANTHILNGKHLYLFIAGVLTLGLLILPYTFGLALFQYLQACSGHRGCWWVNKLKPVFDAYAGPYNDRYRMWTGLLLVTRTLLIILFSFNITGSPQFNYFVILIISLVLPMLSVRGIYKMWPHNVLEAFFCVQLGIFSGGTIYASNNHGNISALADFSFATALLVFLVILGYHIFSFLRNICRCGGKGHDAIDPEEEEELLFHERERVVPALELGHPCDRQRKRE